MPRCFLSVSYLFQVLEAFCHVLFQAWKAPDFHLVLADLPAASTPHNSASAPTTNLNNPASQVSRSNSCFLLPSSYVQLCQLHSNTVSRSQVETQKSPSSQALRAKAHRSRFSVCPSASYPFNKFVSSKGCCV